MTNITIPQDIKTNEEIESLKYNDLIQYAVSIGMRYQRQSKGVLLQMVLDKMEAINNAISITTDNVNEVTRVGDVPQIVIEPEEKIVTNKRQVDVHISASQQTILNDSDISKSEKMRRLYRRGMTIADIHRVLGTHYSFTYGVIDRYRKMISREVTK